MDDQRKISLSQASKSFGITSLRLENNIDAAIIPLPSSSSTSVQSSGSVQHVAPCLTPSCSQNIAKIIEIRKYDDSSTSIEEHKIPGSAAVK